MRCHPASRTRSTSTHILSTSLRFMGSFLGFMHAQGFPLASLPAPWLLLWFLPRPAWFLQELSWVALRASHALCQVTSAPSLPLCFVSSPLLPWPPCPTTSGQSAKVAVILQFCGLSEPILVLRISLFSAVTETVTCEFSRSLFRIH